MPVKSSNMLLECTVKNRAFLTLKTLKKKSFKFSKRIKAIMEDVSLRSGN